MTAMTVYARMTEILTTVFSPSELKIVDNSHLHAGHAGARPEGETHFHVTMVSERFSGVSRVQRQRLVYSALEELLNTRIHALQLKLHTPEEIA